MAHVQEQLQNTCAIHSLISTSPDLLYYEEKNMVHGGGRGALLSHRSKEGSLWVCESSIGESSPIGKRQAQENAGRHQAGQYTNINTKVQPHSCYQSIYILLHPYPLVCVIPKQLFQPSFTINVLTVFECSHIEREMDPGGLALILSIAVATLGCLYMVARRVNEWIYESRLGEKRLMLPPGDMGWPLIGSMWSFLRAFKSGEPDSFIASFVKR